MPELVENKPEAPSMTTPRPNLILVASFNPKDVIQKSLADYRGRNGTYYPAVIRSRV